MCKNINCVSNYATEIPEQCLDCGKLKTCLELNAIKWDTCKSKDVATGVYDPLIDFKPQEK